MDLLLSIVVVCPDDIVAFVLSGEWLNVTVLGRIKDICELLSVPFGKIPRDELVSIVPNDVFRAIRDCESTCKLAFSDDVVDSTMSAVEVTFDNTDDNTGVTDLEIVDGTSLE